MKTEDGARSTSENRMVYVIARNECSKAVKKEKTQKALVKEKKICELNQCFMVWPNPIETDIHSKNK